MASLRQRKGQWLDLPKSDLQPSLKSLALEDVILLLSQRQPCSTNRPTIIGFGNWPMGESCTSSLATGDVAAVVFATELLSQLRNGGIDLDRVSQVRATQDGKTLDKTSNTKYSAQIIAEHIQGWLPLRSTDPDSQHEIAQLRSQLEELRQRFGKKCQMYPLHLARVNKAPALNPHPSDVP